ncbi:MAG: hypothetical protein RLZ04_474 [Actinomycetota bacterium]
MTPLVVAFDTGPLHGPLTGVGFATEHMRSALAAQGDVTLHEYVLSFRAQLRPGTTRLPLPAALAQRAWASTGWPRVDRWLGDAQLVHGTNYVVPPSRLPRIITIHDVWFLREARSAAPGVVRAGRAMTRALTSGAVAHVPSQATAEALRSLVPSVRATVVPLGPLPLGPAPETCPYPELSGRPFVLAIGTLERRKNIPSLVAAFARMRDQIDGLQLVLAGTDGDDAESVRRAVDETRTGDAVMFTGRVDGDARTWLLRNARVLAYPSLDEGFGFPLLDAMQAGVPVVASTAGSIPEVAGDAALMCAPDDTDRLAELLATACTDDVTRRRLVAAGTSRLATFDWAHTAAGLVDLYHTVLRGDLP